MKDLLLALSEHAGPICLFFVSLYKGIQNFIFPNWNPREWVEQESATVAEKERSAEIARYIQTGEASEELLDYIDQNPEVDAMVDRKINEMIWTLQETVTTGKR